MPLLGRMVTVGGVVDIVIMVPMQYEFSRVGMVVVVS